MMKKLAGILAGLCLSVLAFGQLDITKRNVTVTQNFHVRSDTVLNAGEVAEMINDSVDLAAKQDTGLSLLKSDTITKIPTVTQLSDSLDSWNTSLAKQITADDTTWWGQSTDTTNISLRIDSCLKVADSTDYITTHAYQTDTAGASNTGTVPAYRYNYWNSKQNALTNPVTSASASYSDGYYAKFNGTTNQITSSILVNNGNYVRSNHTGSGGFEAYTSATGANQYVLTAGTVVASILNYGNSYTTTALRGILDIKNVANAKIRFLSNNTHYASIASDGNFEVTLGKAIFWQATIGSNATNDKKWSATTDYRAIFQNYSGGDYGDSVSIANNGDIYTPGLIRIGSTNADSIAATRGWVEDTALLNGSTINGDQFLLRTKDFAREGEGGDTHLAINESGDFGLVTINADTLELNADTTYINGELIVSGNINGAPPILFISDTLSSASILAGTIKQIIAAPGSGYYINIISTKLTYKHGGTDYVGAYSIYVSLASDLSDILMVSSEHIEYPSSFTDNILSSNTISTDMNNKAIYWGIYGGTPTTGNGTLKIDILYMINDY